MSIGPDHVKAMVHLVSHAVQGLSPENITVVDTAGKVLSDLLDEEFFIYTGGSRGAHRLLRLSASSSASRRGSWRTRSASCSKRVFGPGKVVVRIKVDLDFDRRTSATKEYIPGETGKGVIRSQQQMEETYTGTGGAVGGAPGTTTNIPGYALAQQQAGQTEYAKTETTNNYEITTRETQQVVTPGAIQRLTASVLVDGELEQTRIDGLRALVAPAIGLNEARGDQLEINGMPFSTTFADTLADQLAAERGSARHGPGRGGGVAGGGGLRGSGLDETPQAQDAGRSDGGTKAVPLDPGAALVAPTAGGPGGAGRPGGAASRLRQEQAGRDSQPGAGLAFRRVAAGRV